MAALKLLRAGTWDVFMGHRNTRVGLRVRAGLSVCILMLCGCASGVALGIVSVGVTGKSIADNMLDIATGEDCNLFQAAVGDGRQVCVPREAAATRSPMRLYPPGAVPEGPAAGSPRAGPLEPAPDPEPGGPSGSAPY